MLDETSSCPVLTIVMPAYNEEENLNAVLSEGLTFSSDRNWFIIVVDDGSTDGTKTILDQLSPNEHLKVIHHKVRRGYGGALKTGIMDVKTEYVVTMDSDGQHFFSDLEKLLGAIVVNDADMVVGSRVGQQPASVSRAIGKWLIRRIAKMLMPISIHDINSGMKLSRTELAKKYMVLCPDSMAFSDVITLTFISQRHLVIEEPIRIRDRVQGKSTINVRTAFDTVIEIINIVTLFNPMKVFLPVSIISILSGLLWGIPIVLQGKGVSVGTMLAITLGVICFFLGLIAEQISLIRKGKIYVQ